MQYGLPSRIRCDKEGENTLVSQFMLNHPVRGSGRKSSITRNNVHNVRMERLWRDLDSGCICYFRIFTNSLYYLKPTSLTLTILYLLHYTHVPWIQHQLDFFHKVWSQHKFRTAKHKSPLQLWITGMLTMTGQVAVQGLHMLIYHLIYLMKWV